MAPFRHVSSRIAAASAIGLVVVVAGVGVSATSAPLPSARPSVQVANGGGADGAVCAYESCGSAADQTSNQIDPESFCHLRRNNMTVATVRLENEIPRGIVNDQSEANADGSRTMVNKNAPVMYLNSISRTWNRGATMYDANYYWRCGIQVSSVEQSSRGGSTWDFSQGKRTTPRLRATNWWGAPKDRVSDDGPDGNSNFMCAGESLDEDAASKASCPDKAFSGKITTRWWTDKYGDVDTNVDNWKCTMSLTAAKKAAGCYTELYQQNWESNWKFNHVVFAPSMKVDIASTAKQGGTPLNWRVINATTTGTWPAVKGGDGNPVVPEGKGYVVIGNSDDRYTISSWGNVDTSKPTQAMTLRLQPANGDWEGRRKPEINLTVKYDFGYSHDNTWVASDQECKYARYNKTTPTYERKCVVPGYPMGVLPKEKNSSGVEVDKSGICTVTSDSSEAIECTATIDPATAGNDSINKRWIVDITTGDRSRR